MKRSFGSIIFILVLVFSSTSYGKSWMSIGSGTNKVGSGTNKYDGSAVMTTGKVFPGTAATTSSSPYDDVTWLYPNYIKIEDGIPAECDIAGLGEKTYLLVASNFDFSSVPDEAIILGVYFSIKARTVGVLTDSDMTLCQLVDDAGALMGDNKCAVPTTMIKQYGVYTYGGVVDLWGGVITPAIVKNANFGVAIGLTDLVLPPSVGVDYISLQVFYYVP